MYIGYACRMAVELGMNRYMPKPPESETDDQFRERRNRERTYLVLWVHDRSLAMQTGRHWMLPEDDLVKNSHHWHESKFIRPEDVIVAAFVQLRRIAVRWSPHLVFFYCIVLLSPFLRSFCGRRRGFWTRVRGCGERSTTAAQLS
jgi:hypothetical protein